MLYLKYNQLVNVFPVLMYKFLYIIYAWFNDNQWNSESIIKFHSPQISHVALPLNIVGSIFKGFVPSHPVH